MEVQRLRLHSQRVERDFGSYTQPSMTSYLLLFGFSCIFSSESEMPFLCQKSHLHIAAQIALRVYSLIDNKIFIFDMHICCIYLMVLKAQSLMVKLILFTFERTDMFYTVRPGISQRKFL